MKSAFVRSAAFLVIWSAFSACGGDVTSGITDPIKTDTTKTQTQTTVTPTQRVNALLAEITNASNAASQGNSASGIPSSSPEPGFSAPALFAAAPPDNSALCVLDTLTVRFNCPQQTAANGVVTTMYFQLLDSLGTPMRGFDTLKTVKVRRVSDKVGAYSSPLTLSTGQQIQAIDSINNHEEMLLNAARNAPHKLNGTGKMNVVLVPDPSSGRPVVHITAPTTTDSVGFFTDSTKHYPNSGKVTAIVTSQETGSGPVTTTQITSYDGTTIAKLTILLPGNKQRVCTYDMTNPNTAPVCTG